MESMQETSGEEKQAEVVEQSESVGEAKVISPRPSKKRRTAKKTSAKRAKKAKKAEKAEDDDDGVRIVSPRPSKKRRTAKKAAPKRAKKAKTAGDDGDGVRVVSSRPSKKRRSVRVKKAEKTSKKPEIAVPEPTQDSSTAVPEPTQDSSQQMTWGRRSRKSAPIGWQEQAGVKSPSPSATRAPGPTEPSEPKKEQPSASPEQAESKSPAAEPVEKQVKKTERKESDSKSRGSSRSSRSNRSNRSNQPSRSSRSSRSNRSNQPSQSSQSSRAKRESEPARRDRREASPAPSKTLAEMLAEAWTEDKARQFLSEGAFARLAPGLISEDEETPDAEALKEPLKVIRKVLADECMVADDVTDVMLLDMVMNAMADRLDVYRLETGDKTPEDLEVILELRYKADRRLIDTLNALKNA